MTEPKSPDPAQAGKKQVQIQMTDAIAQGSYSNMAAINHTQTEFIMDFIYIQPQAPKGTVFSRVLMHPTQAKRMLGALQQHVQRYEKRFGAIEVQPPTVGEEDLLH